MLSFKSPRPANGDDQRASRGAIWPLTAGTAPLGAGAVSLLACALFSTTVYAAYAGKAELEVQVNGLRNSTGMVGCQIFASAAGFPRNNEQAFSGVFTPITSGSARCVFRALPSGSYAVCVMHDENGNKKLDSNFLGIPNEGYGASNNRTYAMSPPKWEESRFELGEGEKKSLSISLRY